MGKVSLSVCGASESGRVRSNNEDAFAVGDITKGAFVDVSRIRTRVDVGDRGVLLVVSDGMGGEKAGEVASQLSVESICDHLAQSAEPDLTVGLRAAVDHANARVIAAAKGAKRKGMGATICAVLVYDGHALTAEVGDSRAYVLRKGALLPLTKDQTYMQMLLDRGVAPEAVKASKAQNVILQAIGKVPSLVVAQRRLALRKDDRLLLCSDGLFSELSDEKICAVLDGASILGEACVRLIELANKAGGKDNITVLLAEVRGDDLPPAKDGEAFADTLETLRAFELGEADPSIDNDDD